MRKQSKDQMLNVKIVKYQRKDEPEPPKGR